jgi:hypothetical protein
MKHPQKHGVNRLVVERKRITGSSRRIFCARYFLTYAQRNPVALAERLLQLQFLDIGLEDKQGGKKQPAVVQKPGGVLPAFLSQFTKNVPASVGTPRPPDTVQFIYRTGVTCIHPFSASFSLLIVRQGTSTHNISKKRICF